ncbi:hypothetical protein MNV49_001198 [Pseudohyphozyma bogoriensis]|nr:hypothetical protein MNV49_001198 [Pseudohyphozyma bogoriensis]
MADAAKDDKQLHFRAEHAGEPGTDKQLTEHHEYQQILPGKIMNPLGGIPRHQLMRDVEVFADQKGLTEHLDILKKGAVLAQSPHDFDNLDVLTEEDKTNIRYEHEHKWAQPLTLYLTVFLCSVGAATQGWDQTGSNGANLSFPIEFGIGALEGEPNYEKDSWLVGIVNSAPYLGSALVGCWLSDPLNNWFGRRGTIFITAVVLVITPIGSAFTQTWEQLFVCRLLLGFGMGAKGSTVPIFAAENAPPLIRGALVMGWQLWTAFGIFLGFAANVIVQDTGRIAWRLQLGSAFIPALPLALFIYMCPESPRWLMKKNRYPAAWKSLVRLRHHELQAARDLSTTKDAIHVNLEIEKTIIKGDNYVSRFFELFTIPRVRRATLASGIVMLAQQMCGINIIAFYSSTIFSDAGYSSRQALYSSLGFGAVNFLFAFPALWTIDTYGRRTLLLFTFPQMAWSLFAAGAAFYIPEDKGTTRIGIISLFIYIFAAFYSPGEGPVPFTYSAEVFPLAQREHGMAWAVSTCLFWAAVLSISLPRMLQVFTSAGVFFFYGGLNVVAFILIFFFLPETKQRTLEELDQVFSIPTKQFASYQLQVALPWWIKKYVLFQNPPEPEPLYQVEGDAEGAPVLSQKAMATRRSSHAAGSAGSHPDLGIVHLNGDILEPGRRTSLPSWSTVGALKGGRGPGLAEVSSRRTRAWWSSPEGRVSKSDTSFTSAPGSPHEPTAAMPPLVTSLLNTLRSRTSYSCPSPSSPRPPLDTTTLTPFAPLASTSPLFDLSLAYSATSCNAFVVLITRKDRKVCNVAATNYWPSRDLKDLNYIKHTLGPDGFQIRVDGAERLALDTPTAFDRERCEYRWEFVLRNAGPVWLDAMHLYENYDGFMESSNHTISRLMSPLLSSPLELSVCHSSCHTTTLTTVGPASRSVFPPPPSSPLQKLPSCTGPDPVSGSYFPTSLESTLYPPHPLPIAQGQTTAGRYGFVPTSCAWDHDGLRGRDHSRCLEGKHRALLLGDSHARGVFDNAKFRLEGGEGFAMESFKADSKVEEIGNLHLEFLWDPWIYNNFSCAAYSSYDSITLSTGAHQACYGCPPTTSILATLDDIFSTWPEKLRECRRAERGAERRRETEWIWMNTPAWHPQRKEEKDCRTGQRLEYWNERAGKLARESGWKVIDVFALTRPFAIDTQLMDGVHYIRTDAIDPITDEWIEKVGICGSDSGAGARASGARYKEVR